MFPRLLCLFAFSAPFILQASPVLSSSVYIRSLPNGSKCTKSTMCASAYCRHGSCDVKKPDGHVCYKNEGCISNSCINKTCASSSSTLSCKLDSSAWQISAINSFEFTTVDPRAFPDPILTFASVKDSSGNIVLSPVSRNSKTAIKVDFYDCNSVYMGYKQRPSSGNEANGLGMNYGQIRIPSLNNDCLTVVSPKGRNTTITHKPCSNIDNASQLPQFFGLFGTDSGLAINYLGGTRSETGSDVGYTYPNGYPGVASGPGRVYTLIKGYQSDYSFFFLGV